MRAATRAVRQAKRMPQQSKGVYRGAGGGMQWGPLSDLALVAYQAAGTQFEISYGICHDRGC